MISDYVNLVLLFCRKCCLKLREFSVCHYYVIGCAVAHRVLLSGFLWVHLNVSVLVSFVQEMSNKEIDLTYKLKVLQQELEQEEASHKATRALLADKSKIKVTIEGAKSESMKGKGTDPVFHGSCSLTFLLIYFNSLFILVCTITRYIMRRRTITFKI